MIPIGFLSLWMSDVLDTRPIEWTDYSKTDLIQHVTDNKTVMVVYTADWCMTCKFVEEKTLQNWRIRRLLRKNNVVAMKRNATNNTSEIIEELKSVGVASLPVIVIYSSHHMITPIVLEGFPTEKQILDGLRKSFHR